MIKTTSVHKSILIAGGTGLIGIALAKLLEQHHYQVYILTRNMNLCNNPKYRWWNPDKNEISDNALKEVDVIINLCGAGIADKRWTDKRKQELSDSRTKPAQVLRQAAQKSGNIRHYISASGINCYPVNTQKRVSENDAYGTDYLSRLVQEWEHEALKFEEICPVSLLRISAVLSDKGGALTKLKPLFKWGLGSPLGSGKQPFTWVHEADLHRAIYYVVANELSGAYNICGETISNRAFSSALAKSMKRWMLPIGVPSFVMRLMLGEMSEMLVNGVNTHAEKLTKTDFTFKYRTISEALNAME
jgi:uncharacterized protein (TIGR01777 family)